MSACWVKSGAEARLGTGLPKIEIQRHRGLILRAAQIQLGLLSTVSVSNCFHTRSNYRGREKTAGLGHGEERRISAEVGRAGSSEAERGVGLY